MGETLGVRLLNSILQPAQAKKMSNPDSFRKELALMRIRLFQKMRGWLRAATGPFGRTVLPLDDALRVIEQEGIFWTRV
jgi:hypothetical protein